MSEQHQNEGTTQSTAATRPLTASDTSERTQTGTAVSDNCRNKDMGETNNSTVKYVIPNRYRGISTALHTIIVKHRQAKDHLTKLTAHKTAGTVPMG